MRFTWSLRHHKGDRGAATYTPYPGVTWFWHDRDKNTLFCWGTGNTEEYPVADKHEAKKLAEIHATNVARALVSNTISKLKEEIQEHENFLATL